MPLVPLGLRRLWAGVVILDLWCERAGMPNGTTIDQLDGRTVIPEKPEMLERFVRGRALGPSAAATRVAPLDDWPAGLRLENVVSPVFVRRLAGLGLDEDPRKVILLTIGDLLKLPRFGPGNAILFGCEVEAGVEAFRAGRSLPSQPKEAHAGRPESKAGGETAVSMAATSVPALVQARFGVRVACSHTRFEQPGWELQGVCDISCGDCDVDACFVIYRKPYTTTRGSHRYWAIVCLSCRTVDALKEFENDDQKSFRAWDTEMAVEEVAPTPPEEPEPKRAEARREAEDHMVDEVETQDTLLPPAPEEPQIEPMDSPRASPPTTEQGIDQVVVAAAQAELAASTGQARQVDVGRVARDETGPTVVFRVAAPTVDLSEQPPGEVFLASSGGEGARYKAQVRYASATEAVVTAADAPAGDHLHLYLQIDPGVVAKAFVTYLEACKTPGPAAVLAGRGRLAASPSEQLAGLNAEQQTAAGSITSPGVSVIWGPPGTGKTRVIGAAVAELFRRGRSIALVSNTNVAVDQALLHVCRVAEPFEPGEILRVGHPSIPQVTAHPTLLTAKAIQVKFRDLLEQLEQLQAELSSARSAAATAGGARLHELLKGHTTSTLEMLVAHQRGLLELAGVKAEIATQVAHVAELRAAFSAAGKRYDEARGRCARWANFLGVLEDEREVASLNKTISDSDLVLGTVKRQIQLAANESWWQRHRKVRELSATLAGEEEARTRTIVLRDAHLRRLEEASQDGATPAAIRADQSDEATCESSWREAKERLGIAEATLQRLNKRALPLWALAELTEHQVGILGHIDRCGSARNLVDEARREQKEAARSAESIRDLSSKIESLQRRLHDQEATLVAGAKVVGTTLAQLMLHRGLVGRTFDHVVIDEASSALPPYVYAAMTKASVGCTLVGDFEQNWPITRCDVGKLPPEVGRWLTSDPFGLLGIETSADATADPGCVVLRDQYRFGDQTMRLANAIAYGGLLRHGRDDDLLRSEGPEIVIIDTSSLADGAAAEKGTSGSGRWWAVGAALSFELSRQHGFEGVGVVAPYRYQVQLTRAQLKDGGGTAVQIGTAHAFQGREFPVVIADLVEDGTGTSWVARADRTGSQWARDGARLFNVAVTRNAGRLYVISNAGSIRSARSGPLRALAEVLHSGDAELWDARTVLGHQAPSTATSEAPLIGGRSVPHILDDNAFYGSLLRDLDSSEQRVVIFSPFVARRRLDDLLPVLQSLVDRGVRVTVFTKAAHELRDPQLLLALRKCGVVVHERQGMHEKVVIVDQLVTYVGSLNALSNTGRTGEIMLRLHGEDTTGRIAQWMRFAARSRR